MELAEAAGALDAALGFLGTGAGSGTADFAAGGGGFPHPVECSLGRIDVVRDAVNRACGLLAAGFFPVPIHRYLPR
jgi:hypothetical protein